MNFKYYGPDLIDEPKISVDGIVPNSFHLSHWSGNKTPKVYKADTSTEIALNFVADPNHKQYVQNLTTLTNNHFDTDGLLSLWTLLQPAQALLHRERLIGAAEAGDFNQYTDDSAVQLNFLVTAFRESPDSPLLQSFSGLTEADQDECCYTHLLEILPSVLSNPKPYAHLWEGAYKKLLKEFDQFEKGEILVKEFPEERLSVVVSEHKPSKMAIDRYCRGDLFLIVQTRAEGFCYDLEYRYYTWADTVQRPSIAYTPMETLASRLNVYDGRALGRWTVEGYAGRSLTSVLKYTNPDGEPLPSRFPFENVAQFVRDYIREKKETS